MFYCVINFHILGLPSLVLTHLLYLEDLLIFQQNLRLSFFVRPQRNVACALKYDLKIMHVSALSGNTFIYSNYSAAHQSESLLMY